MPGSEGERERKKERPFACLHAAVLINTDGQEEVDPSPSLPPSHPLVSPALSNPLVTPTPLLFPLSSTMLDKSQANALVYSTLCGFLLVGLFAGYKVKSKVDFLSGIRTQSAFPLSLNWIASS